MGNIADKRQFQRFSIFSFPILIDAPSLSDFVLDPEDISLGGFRVVVSEEPKIENLIDCSVEMKGKEYQGCNARIAWISEIETDPPPGRLAAPLRIAGSRPAGFG